MTDTAIMNQVVSAKIGAQPETSLISERVEHNGYPSFNSEALRKRYNEERDKRMRHNTRGVAQYVHIDNELASLLEDPYSGKRIKREPMKVSCDVLIIGGGYGGILTAVRLQQRGITNIKIVEKGGDFGGTWYWNRYASDCPEYDRR